MKKIITLMVIICAGILFTLGRNEKKTYYYDKYETLTGVLKLETVEDDTGYESGKATEVYILVLDNAITIKEETPMFGDGTPDIVTELHVGEPFERKVAKPLKQYVGKRVKIKGELVKAHTGYHKRDALLLDAEIQ